jgi:hypothetical protein
VKVIQELETRMHPDSIAGFRLVIAEARVTDSILLPERPMRRMVGHVQWMLRRVGDDGIRLTPAGFLPPAVVLEATTELDWGWPEPVNRESYVTPLRELREHLVEIGLLRVSRGRLLQTSRGRALAEAPRELWWHLARTIHAGDSPAESDAIRLLLVLVARRGFDEGELFRAMLALSLQTLGWEQPNGEPLPSHVAFRLVATKWRLLKQLGVFDRNMDDLSNIDLRTIDGSNIDRWTVTPGGAAFARAALQSEV